MAKEAVFMMEKKVTLSWLLAFYGEMLTPLSLIGAAIVFISVLSYNLLMIKKQAETA